MLLGGLQPHLSQLAIDRYLIAQARSLVWVEQPPLEVRLNRLLVLKLQPQVGIAERDQPKLLSQSMYRPRSIDGRRSKREKHYYKAKQNLAAYRQPKHSPPLAPENL